MTGTGVKETESGFDPVRYETKSLPEDQTRLVKIRLTRNQLSVYRKVRLEDDSDQEPLHGGDWKLLGVKPNSRAMDLTDGLEKLPSLLRPLQMDEYDHDGLLIYIDTSEFEHEERRHPHSTFNYHFLYQSNRVSCEQTESSSILNRGRILLKLATEKTHDELE